MESTKFILYFDRSLLFLDVGDGGDNGVEDLSK